MNNSIALAPATAQDDPAASPAPCISVVVPVRNEARFIGRTLDRLLAQRYEGGRFEVIVVDGESTDDTWKIVAEYVRRRDNVRLLHNPRRWSSAGRNIGVQHARGDLILIVDGHCEIDDELHLTRLAGAFERSGADCIGRPQPLDVSGASPLQRAVAAARSSWLGHHPDSHIYSGQEAFVPAKSVAVAYRRQVFDRIGYFDERFDACEDVEFNHRIDSAGLWCLLSPEAAVRYIPRDSLPKLFRQLVRYGRGRMRLLLKHRDTFSVMTLVPALFVLGCLVGGVASLAFPRLGILYLAVLGLYAAVVLAVSIATATRQRSPSLLFWLPVVFATIHVASGVGLLGEALEEAAALGHHGALSRNASGQEGPAREDEEVAPHGR